MSKIRTTMHNGRTSKKTGLAYTPKHNDRNYDIENDKHIVKNKSEQNVYWNVIDNKVYQGKDKSKMHTFEDAITKFIEKNYKKQWVDTNYKYECNSQFKRIKTFDEWRDSSLFARPEETILQVGKYKEDGTADAKQLWNIYRDFCTKREKWNKEHGNVFVIYTIALHVDEAVPHIHEQKGWQYRNDAGTLCMGQEEALKRANIPLPKPGKKKSRHNNRKMTFDKIMRDMWIETCIEHGFDIEKEADVYATHNMSKEEYIDKKLQAEKEALKEKELELNKKEDLLREKIEDADKIKEDAEKYKAKWVKRLESPNTSLDAYAKFAMGWMQQKGYKEKCISDYSDYLDSENPNFNSIQKDNGFSL